MTLAPGRVDYLPITERPTIKWPGGARVAVWVVPNVEHYEYLPIYDGKRDPWPRTPYPDVQQYSNFDFGNRVGFWRMLEVFDKYRIRATASLNLAVLEHFPEIAQAMADRDWDLMSHGLYNTQYTTTFSEAEERAFIAENIAVLKRHTGRQLKGMLGPAVTDTERTPDLLAEAGVLYHADWVHDDQPVPIKVKSGRLVSIPYSMELNDGMTFRYACDQNYFAMLCKAQFDQLWEEGQENGRVMCLSLHPYLIGRPNRIGMLDDILGHILSHNGVWQATGEEIAEHFLAHHYDDWMARVATLNQVDP